MSVLPFLAELHVQDIRVWADGDRLRCNAPADLMTHALREQLQSRKEEILEFFRSAETLTQRHRAIVPLQARGTGVPIFGVPGHGGDVFTYLNLAQHLGPDFPFYGLQPPGLDGQGAPLTRIEDLAAYFAAQIKAFHPSGPCIVTGFCAGGMTAFELGRQLEQSGTPVKLIALFGAAYPSAYRLSAAPGLRLEWLATHLRALRRLGWRERWAYVKGKRALRRAERGVGRAPDPVFELRARVIEATMAAARRYTPAPFAGRVSMLLPNRGWLQSRTLPLAWGTIAGEADVYIGPDGCTQDNMLREPYAGAFAAHLVQCVAAPARGNGAGPVMAGGD